MATTASPSAPSPSAAPDPEQGEHALCSPNIGPAELRKRRIVGMVGLAVCAVGSALLISDGAPRLWRVILFLPWWTACLGIFQARSRVCVALAARGLRNLDGNQEPQPAEELGQVQREARRVHVRALLTAVLLTLLTMAWP
jgi:hypothetical protein